MDFRRVGRTWRGFCASILNFLLEWGGGTEGSVAAGAVGMLFVVGLVGSSCMGDGEGQLF